MGGEAAMNMQELRALNTEETMPSEMEIMERSCGGFYANRYALLRDLVLNLYWSGGYSFHLYRGEPRHWRDIPAESDKVLLPVYNWWQGDQWRDTVADRFRCLEPAWDEEVENFLFDHLIALFRMKPPWVTEFGPAKWTVCRILQEPDNLVLVMDSYSPADRRMKADDLEAVWHRIPQLESLLRLAMILGSEHSWHIRGSRLCRVADMHNEDLVMLFYPRNPHVVGRSRREGVHSAC